SVLALRLTVRIKGVSGDWIPQLAWRWSAGPQDLEDRTADAAAIATVSAAPEDFPQFLGPERDGKVRGVRLARDWENQPPRLMWRREVGPAWSGFAVAGGVAVTQEQRDDEEVVAAYELRSGEPLWSSGAAARFETTIGGTGPRATPTIDDGRVFTMGALGLLSCLDLATGEALWSRNVVEENRSGMPQWGKSGSPLVFDGLVVVTAGGDGQALIAYDCETGEERWRGGDDRSSYSSPFVIELAGVPQIVIFNAASVAGHDPGDGSVLWQHPWPYGASGYRSTRAEVPGSSGLVEAQLAATVPWGTVEFEDGDRDRLVRLYDRDVRRMDEVLGRVLGALEAHGRGEKTLVIFVADHGEELLDDDWIGHASTAVRAKMMPEILRVPLVLAGPGIPTGGLRDELVQQVDVLPTVLRLLEMAVPPEIDGRRLPGIPLPGFTWPWRRGERQLAFFDTSPGGNLTPQDRRGERLQAVTDGTGCLVAVHTYLDRPQEVSSRALDGERGPCDRAVEAALVDEIESWQQRQTRQRLAVLARYPAGSAPPSDEVDGYAERLEVLDQSSGEALSWETTGGQIALAWTGYGEKYWIEYRLSDLLRTSGSFQVEQQRVVFGPVPQGFWNDLAGYSPFRIRLVDAENRERSAWVEYEVLPTGG
ncbi:MAG: PQQ-binding-like beta-propeller repeat protein, partial [Thermoanaerobaculia bacterium]